MSGLTSYQGGLAAEGSVERHYLVRAYELVATRWRSKAGEIDLILRKNDVVVFVEVKKSKSIARAAEMLNPSQIARIYTAAQIFLEGEPDGQNTPARFDVALVGPSGEIEILKNAIQP